MTYKAIALCRVSSANQIEGDSLDDQELVGFKLAKTRFGYDRSEVKVFREVYSGSIRNRPTLNKVFQFIEEHQVTLQQVIILDIDRLSRAGAGFYEHIKNSFKKFGLQLIDANGVIQEERNALEGTGASFGQDFSYDWSHFSPSEGDELRRAHQAKEERQKILVRTIPKQIRNIQNGYESRAAIYGYQNKKVFLTEEGKRKTIGEIEPKESKFILRMYQEAALIHKGITTSRKACDEINALGFQTRTHNKWNLEKTQIIGKIGGKKLTPKQFWRFVENTNYCGLKCERWTHFKLVKSQSEPIVSVDLWNQANTHRFKLVKSQNNTSGWSLIDLTKASHTRYNKDKATRSHQKIRNDFPFKQLIRCHVCGKPLKAAYSTGKSGKKFGYYFCNRGHKQSSIKPSELIHELDGLFNQLTFKKGSIELLEKAIRFCFQKELSQYESLIEEKNSRVEQLKSKAEVIVGKIESLSNPQLLRKCEKDYENTLKEIDFLESKNLESRYSEVNLELALTKLKKLVEHPKRVLEKPDQHKVLASFWSCIFKVNPTIDQIKGRTPELSVIMRFSASQFCKKIRGIPKGNLVEHLTPEFREELLDVVFRLKSLPI